MANRVVLTVADHEQNGFVALAKWSGLTYDSAVAFIASTDASISDDEEPDGSDAAFTFILDLVDERTGDLLDTGKRLLLGTPMSDRSRLIEMRRQVRQRIHGPDFNGRVQPVAEQFSCEPVATAHAAACECPECWQQLERG